MNSPSYPSAGSLPYQQRPRTWFDKNWKWFVPMVVVVGALVIAAFVGAVLYGVESMFRNSYPYQQAVQRATASPAVAEKIGQPLHIGWFVAGNVNFSGSEGSATMSVPISGPKGSGHIVVVGKKHADRWTFEILQVNVEGQDEPIPLLHPEPATSP
ncbi:MAG: cytochrome c oxidase assembly factor Coa1 family protein [Candidatus Acidiferrales bacterium]